MKKAITSRLVIERPHLANPDRWFAKNVLICLRVLRYFLQITCRAQPKSGRFSCFHRLGGSRWEKALQLVLSAMLILSCSRALAAEPVLNKVIYQFSAKQWVVAHRARVVIVVDATTQSHQLEQSRRHIVTQLANLMPNMRWHITQLMHSQDQSGLAKLHLQAQARVPTKAIVPLQQKIKKLSQPGKKFKVQSVDFTPSLAEQQAVRAQLRERIYQQVKQELQRLNKVFPKQTYFLHNAAFGDSPRYRATVLTKMPQPSARSVPIGREAVLHAQVVLSSVVNAGQPS